MLTLAIATLTSLVYSQNRPIKRGGVIVYEKDGTGLVVAPSDLGTMNYVDAFRACNDLVLNGFSNWRLPTNEELDSLYKYRKRIRGFGENSYWSGNVLSGGGQALRRNFGNGGIYQENDLKRLLSVRPVRLYGLDTNYGYSISNEVNELGLPVLPLKEGGYIVYEKDGHGLVVAPYAFTTIGYPRDKSQYPGDASFEKALILCDTLVLNGFSDWRLPTKDELTLMYINRIKIGGGWMADPRWDNIVRLWSSTKVENQSDWWRWSVNWSQKGLKEPKWDKSHQSEQYKVWCVRTF